MMVHGDTHAARCGKFVGMNLGTHAISSTSLQDAGCLFGSEEALVAEDVDVIG